ncbi:GDSL-type esterase/lipase family protein [Umezawaea beigongshangensis]|uniref:GDSL-type esterase/lipase family protein n=1 Tax=Umezawaea beigongshangensis TaxID=2780383 RepID=UPI0018F1DDBD|nr:GDSL-type esterase/lipase family protein [Umezawaea beigongshangensis]
MSSLVRRSLALLLVVPLLTLVVVASDHPVPQRRGPGLDAPTAVVAMGDSTMSGEGAGEYEPGTDGENGNWCHRSARAEINATVVPGVQRTVNLACSSASSTAVSLTDQLQNTERSQAARLAEVARTHRVVAVVIAVGANDDPRFSEVLGRCVQAWLERRADCRDTLDSQWPQRVRDMVPKVVTALADVRTVMRDAGYLPSSYDLVVQSYASPVAPDVPRNLQNLAGCPVRGGDATWVRDTAVRELADGLREAANTVDARFLDLSGAGAGHEACTGGDDASREWFTRLQVDWNGLRDESRASHVLQESFHPNERGHAAFAQCLSQFLGTADRAARCVASGDGLRAEPEATAD